MQIETEQHRPYVAIDRRDKLLLGAVVSEQGGPDPAAEFLSPSDRKTRPFRSDLSHYRHGPPDLPQVVSVERPS